MEDEAGQTGRVRRRRATAHASPAAAAAPAHLTICRLRFGFRGLDGTHRPTPVSNMLGGAPILLAQALALVYQFCVAVWNATLSLPATLLTVLCRMLLPGCDGRCDGSARFYEVGAFPGQPRASRLSGVIGYASEWMARHAKGVGYLQYQPCRTAAAAEPRHCHSHSKHMLHLCAVADAGHSDALTQAAQGAPVQVGHPQGC